MNFVLDTNVVSETRKPRPYSGLLDWLAAQDPSRLFITTVTLAEVWHGFYALKPEHPDHRQIQGFATALSQNYRVLNFDRRAAVAWGDMTAQTTGPLPLRDSFIAAIANSRGYRLVTRDAEAFERMGCKVLNPWR